MYNTTSTSFGIIVGNACTRPSASDIISVIAPSNSMGIASINPSINAFNVSIPALIIVGKLSIIALPNDIIISIPVFTISGMCSAILVAISPNVFPIT